MIHQQLPPKPLLFPHIEATSVCFLEHPLLVPCYSAGEKMCGNIAENYSPAPGRSPIPRMRGTAERQALPPAFMRGEGREAAGGVPRRSGESLLSHGCAVPAPPEGKPRALRTVLAPAFMRGEGHAVAGGVPRRGGESLLSHGFAVPALPKGEPRALRTVLAPRIYEGGGPRSGRGSPPPQRGRPSQSRLRRASSPKGRARGAALRSPVVGRDPLGWQKMWKYSGFFLKKGLQNRGDSGIIPT